MNILELFFICATAISITAIICYTGCYLLTNPTVIKAVKDICRENFDKEAQS